MKHESFLHRLRDQHVPSDGAKDRIHASIQARIGGPAVLRDLQKSLDPSHHMQQDIWARILHRIDNPSISTIFDRIRGIFDPSAGLQSDMRKALQARLSPAPIGTPYGRMKWVAAFALVLVALRASPAVFLAPRTIAESRVLVVPTSGDVSVSLQDLWQPVTHEIALNEPTALQTGKGEATVMLHDDGTIRLAHDTIVTINDLSDRPESTSDIQTITLTQGNLWVQGFVPRYAMGLTVATPFGSVSLHEGSMSLSLNEDSLTVQVWDRTVTLEKGDAATVLVTGEQATFKDAGLVGSVTRVPEKGYDDAWVAENLRKDAVHQREVAQMQRERSAARAGILPTSPLYTVKRVAEQVDVLLTIDPAAKVQKQIDNASTRLNEAAALIAEGSGTGATASLEEYKETLLAIANGSGGNALTQMLLSQQVAENAAGLSAAQPTDELYALKKAVLEAGADLPSPVLNDADINGMVLVDSLEALHDAVIEGDTVAAKASYVALQPYLPLLKDALLPEETRKEALSLITLAADQLEATGTGSDADAVAAGLEPFVPVQPSVVVTVPSVEPLSDEGVAIYALQILNRISTFSHPRPRMNQMVYEVKQLANHRDAGRILRQLYHLLPDDEESLKLTVRRAIQDLR